MKLPLRFFDTKMVGDIMQRIGNHNRIESFLTGSSISTLFSFFNFFIFGFILAYYSPLILGIFLLGNTLEFQKLGISEAMFMMKKQKKL